MGLQMAEISACVYNQGPDEVMERAMPKRFLTIIAGPVVSRPSSYPNEKRLLPLGSVDNGALWRVTIGVVGCLWRAFGAGLIAVASAPAKGMPGGSSAHPLIPGLRAPQAR
jgi:hypothetical protein